MRIAFWKIIVVTIVKNQTVHVMVATDNKFCIKITVISQNKRTTNGGSFCFDQNLFEGRGKTCQGHVFTTTGLQRIPPHTNNEKRNNADVLQYLHLKQDDYILSYFCTNKIYFFTCNFWRRII